MGDRKLEKLERKYFDNDKQYQLYEEAHKNNSPAADSKDLLGDSYVIAIWNLINLFIKENDCSDETIKKSPDYEKFSGSQVDFATGWYNQLRKTK